MNPCELTLSITALANAFAANLTIDQLDLAAAVFTQLGDTLAVIATQRAVQQARCEREAEAAMQASEYSKLYLDKAQQA